VLLTTYWY